MKNKLLATVALSAVVGFSTLAAAQNSTPGGQAGKETLRPHGGQPQLKAGHNGVPTNAPTNARRGPQSAQNEPTTGGQTGQSTIPDKIAPKSGTSQDQLDRGSTSPAPERGAPNGPKDEDQRGAQKDDSPRGTQSTEKNGTEPAGPSGKSAQLSVEQRTKIKTVVGRGHVARVDHPDFSVRVGTVVPRNVHVNVLPTEIVEIVPEYRGFDYVMVGDEILIIDPHSLEIVAIVEA